MADVDDVVAGRIKFHELDGRIGKKAATETRRRALEKILGVELGEVAKFSEDPEQLIGKNIENMIGCVQIPLGVAGPVRVNGAYAKGDFFVPLAATEGALVASVNRGCSVINASGGAKVRVVDSKQTRAPCFRVNSSADVKKFVAWVENNFEKIKEKTEEKSHHLKLRRVEPFVNADRVFLRFEADTGDAMGMNMITIGCQNACDWIASQTGADFITVTGNMCADKKPCLLNFTRGRGKTVEAEVMVPESVVREKLKTTPERFVEVNNAKIVGSALARAYGFNAHFANVFKGIFAATGQDEAHIVEGSLGMTRSEVVPGGLRVLVRLPCVQVGTVGGGTRLKTAQECLRIMGVQGGGIPPGTNALKFAEIVGAAVLAGEISLLAAQAAHHLAGAHEKMGR